MRIAVTSIWNPLAPVLSITVDVATLPRPSFRLVDAVFLGTILAIMFIANKAIRHSHWFHMTVWDRFDAANKSLDTLAEIVRKLLLIRLVQHATICSVRGCALRFQRICASSSGNSPVTRLVKTTWQRVAGRTASHVPVADTGGPIGC